MTNDNKQEQFYEVVSLPMTQIQTLCVMQIEQCVLIERNKKTIWKII
ncbi:MAG: hypothetical protein FWH36_08875 [Lentimicrobiaceae bacterium]|nr:hypothetical protein [Lentimicrobiaceae bacterium]